MHRATEVALGAVTGGATILVLWSLVGRSPWTSILAGALFAIAFVVIAYLVGLIKSPDR